MSDSDTFQDIWNEAFKIYQEQTGRKIQNDAQLRKLRSTHDLLSAIDSQNKSFEGFRNHHGKLWSALSSCLQPLDMLGTSLQNALSSSPFAPIVFTSVLHLVHACSNVAESYDYLEGLFAELSDYTVRLQEYLKGGMSAGLKKKSIATLSFLLEIIGRSEKMIKTGRFRQFLGATVFGNDKMKTALERLKTIIDSEERLVIAVTYSSTQQTAQVVGRTEQKVEASAKVIEEMRSVQQSARDEEKKQAEDKTIRNLLDSPAIDKIRDIYSEMNSSIVPGSGMWIQDEPLFDAWIEREAPILWIFGGPGAGKSFLATRIISDLRQRYPQDVEHPSPIAVAYFYVKEDDQHLHDLNTILKSIAFQITFVDPVYRKHVLNIHNSNESVNSPRSTWENLFMKFFSSKSNFEHSVFVIIDGLDEAPTQARRDLLELLHSVVDRASATTRPRMQFAILGRPELRDDIKFSRREKVILVSPQKNHDDIAKYIQEGLKKVSILYRMRPPAAKKFAKQIHDSILQGADGMFLWAKLILAQIYEKERKSEILEALNNAPRELDGMIHHVFERLEKDPDVNHQDLNKVLAWVTCCRRPLLLGELDVILRLPSGEANLALRDRLKGKLASILTLARLEGYEEIVDEPTSAVTERPPNTDFLSFDDLDDSAAVGDYVDDDDDTEDDATAEKDEQVVPDARLQKEFETTQVVFGHKRIKDYIVSSNFKFSPSNPLAIGVDVNKAEIEVTTTLLSILCDGITKGFGQFDLHSYAAENFMKHLESIDISHIDDSDKQRILKLLCRLFHDKDCIRRLLKATEESDEARLSDRGYNEFFHTWIVTNRYTQVLRQWFRELATLKDNTGFEPSELEWIHKSAPSAKELLRPLALVAGHLWLFKTGPDDRAYINKSQFRVWLLNGYYVMDDEGDTKDEFNNFELYRSGMELISLERMKELAELGDVEKTEHWYTGLAWIMMEGNYLEPAMEHFHIALDMNSKLWVAMEGLARCLGSLSRYKEAVSWMEKALESLPSSLRFLANYLLPRMVAWKLELGDLDGAIEAAKNDYELAPYDFGTIMNYIWMLHRGRRSKIIVDLVKELNERESTNFTRSALVHIISYGRNITEPVGLAAAMEDSKDTLEIMRNAFDDAIIAADSDTDFRWCSVIVRIFGANFNHRYLNRIDEAMVFWEAALQLISVNFNDPLKFDSIGERSDCSTHLSRVYFDKAVMAKKNNDDYVTWIDKLKGLARFTKTLESEREFVIKYGTGYPSQLYGIWLREYEHAEEAVWKECFRSSILEGIELLSDDDPTNDQWGYASLGRTLFHAGDIGRGLSALSVTTKPLEALQAQQSSAVTEQSSGDVKTMDDAAQAPSSNTPKDVNANEKIKTGISTLPRIKLSSFVGTFWDCDGSCTTFGGKYRELHFCRICNDVCFCGECILLVKTNQLPYRQCSQDHEWIQVYPVPEEAHDLAAATIRDGYVELHQNWLSDLREQWTK